MNEDVLYLLLKIGDFPLSSLLRPWTSSSRCNCARMDGDTALEDGGKKAVQRKRCDLLLMVQKSGENSPVEVGSLSVIANIYKVLYIPGGAGFFPSTVWMVFCDFIVVRKLQAFQCLFEVWSAYSVFVCFLWSTFLSAVTTVNTSPWIILKSYGWWTILHPSGGTKIYHFWNKATFSYFFHDASARNQQASQFLLDESTWFGVT